VVEVQVRSQRQELQTQRQLELLAVIQMQTPHHSTLLQLVLEEQTHSQPSSAKASLVKPPRKLHLHLHPLVKVRRLLDRVPVHRHCLQTHLHHFLVVQEQEERGELINYHSRSHTA
jgi:hypothetical protein